MTKKLVYLSVEQVIEYNVLAITLIQVKKADKAELLDKSRLMVVVESCKKVDGGVYDKAVFLLK